MLKEISKKLTMKKTFFVTQLEGFFNAISQEYQEVIHQKEMENSLLKEQQSKLEKDIENLVSIKNRLLEENTLYKEQIENLSEGKELNDISHYQTEIEKLKKENEKLKEELQTTTSSPKVQELEAKIQKLQQIIAKGGNSYQSNLNSQEHEALIEKIKGSLQK